MRFLICYALLVSGFSTAFINTLPKINTKTKLNYKPSKRSGGAKAPPAVVPARPSDGEWVQLGGYWLPVDPRRSPVDDEPRCIGQAIADDGGAPERADHGQRVDQAAAPRVVAARRRRLLAVLAVGAPHPLVAAQRCVG